MRRETPEREGNKKKRTGSRYGDQGKTRRGNVGGIREVRATVPSRAAPEIRDRSPKLNTSFALTEFESTVDAAPWYTRAASLSPLDPNEKNRSLARVDSPRNENISNGYVREESKSGPRLSVVRIMPPLNPIEMMSVHVEPSLILV